MLEKLLSVLLPHQVFNKYAVSIERSLHHPNYVVKSTVLAEVNLIFKYLLYLKIILYLVILYLSND